MTNREKTEKITGIAILGAIVITLQLLSNYIQIGPVSITLSLIPIVIGSIIYGPLAGFILGFVNGIIVLIAPSTLSVFFPYHPFYTILICLTKTSIAGLVSGLLFKLLFKNKKLSSIICSLSVPIINTGLFSIYCILFFKDVLLTYTTESLSNIYSVLFLGFIGTNFIIELLVNSILSTVVYQIISMKKKNM